MITQGLVKNEDAQPGCMDSSATSPMHFFLHIPKCGGTTFSDYLSRHFPRSAIYTADKSIADYQTHQLLKSSGRISAKDNFRLLSQRYVESMQSHNLIVENHFEWRVMQRLENRAKIVLYTLLRDPRERFVSHYNHIRRIPLNELTNPSQSVLKFHQLARELPINEFSQQIPLGAFFHVAWGAFFNVQSRFLSSYDLNQEMWKRYGEEKILDNILSNLEQIDFVADLKDLEEFTQLISLSNGWLPPGPLNALNQGGHSSDKTSELLSQVPESFISLDQVIYEAGLKKYAAWKNKVLHDATLKLWTQKPGRNHLSQSGDQWEITFEDILYGNNFHAREGLGKETLRWMGPGLESQLYIPVRPHVTNWISVYIAAFIKPEIYTTTKYSINGQEVKPISSTADNCAVLTFPVDSNQSRSGIVQLGIKVDQTTSEFALSGIHDKREKSIAIRKIKVSLRPPNER